MKPNKSFLKVNAGIEQPSSVNPKAEHLHSGRKVKLSPDDYVTGILNKDRTILSQAITLVESTLPKHNDLAQHILEKCLPNCGNSIRIGITGVPGVGKSTFINGYGTFLVSEKNKKVIGLKSIK